MKKITEQNIKNVQKIMKQIHGPIEHLFASETPVFRGFDEPLPDVIGYHQHGGECVSDSIQESFLFADEIRDYTQPILYNITSTQINIRSKLSLQYIDWERFSDYFEFIQLRFRSHYDTINYLRTHAISPSDYQIKKENVCALDPLFQRKEAHSAEGGILALKKLLKEKTYSQSGMILTEKINTLRSIIMWFDIPFEVVEKKIDIMKSVAINISLINGYLKPDKTIYWYTTYGHATAFIRMMKKWYYYDDNYGFYPVSIDLVKDFMNPVNDCFIFIYQYDPIFTPYFVKGGEYPTHVWTHASGWITDLNRINAYDNGSIQKHSHFLAIQTTDTKDVYHLKCQTDELGHASSSEIATENTRKLIQCIFDNPHSNSAIFEDLYHYVFENLVHVRKNTELYEQITATLGSVLTRPTCSPMIHYWVWMLQRAILEKYPDEKHEWFHIPEYPKLYYGSLEQVPTPENVRERMLEQRAKNFLESPLSISPCPSGQVRDAKTKKCRDRKKPEPKSTNEESTNEEKKERLKPIKRTPCPPGEIRNIKTKKCKPRIALLTPCPPGQVRDKKTKKCRDAKKLKLGDKD